jgi:hypothetical protein
MPQLRLDGVLLPLTVCNNTVAFGCEVE